MTHTYVIAATLVHTPFDAVGLDTDGYADTQLAFEVGDVMPGGVPFPFVGGTGWLDPGGRVARVPRPSNPSQAAWMVRQAVPFAAA
jgi:hypothetical protein